MIEHLINKEDAQNRDAYSTYLNPNKELKAEILNFVANFKPDTIDIGWPSEPWKVGEKDGNEFKCTKGRDVKYVDENLVIEKQKSALKNAINEKYLVGDHFKNAFGVLYSSSDWKFEILNLTNVIDPRNVPEGSLLHGKKLSNLDLNCYESKIEYELDTYEVVGLIINPCVGMMFLSFTNEGDFYNRNYNENLNDFSNVPVSVNLIYDRFVNNLKEAINGETIMKNGKSFYTNSFMFTPYFYIDRQEHKFGFSKVRKRDSNTYKNGSGYKIYKKPAKLEEVSFDDMMSDLNKILPSDTKDFLNDDFIRTYNINFLNRK